MLGDAPLVTGPLDPVPPVLGGCGVCFNYQSGPLAEVTNLTLVTWLGLEMLCFDGTFAGAREGALAPASQSEVAVLLAKVTAVAEAAGLR